MKDKRLKSPMEISTQAPMENLPMPKRVGSKSMQKTSPTKGKPKKIK